LNHDRVSRPRSFHPRPTRRPISRSRQPLTPPPRPPTTSPPTHDPPPSPSRGRKYVEAGRMGEGCALGGVFVGRAVTPAAFTWIIMIIHHNRDGNAMIPHKYCTGTRTPNYRVLKRVSLYCSGVGPIGTIVEQYASIGTFLQNARSLSITPHPTQYLHKWYQFRPQSVHHTTISNFT